MLGGLGTRRAREELLRKGLFCSDSGVGSYSVCEECTNWIMFCPFFLSYVKLLRFFLGVGEKRISWLEVGWGGEQKSGLRVKCLRFT